MMGVLNNEVSIVVVDVKFIRMLLCVRVVVRWWWSSMLGEKVSKCVVFELYCKC